VDEATSNCFEKVEKLGTLNRIFTYWRHVISSEPQHINTQRIW